MCVPDVAKNLNDKVFNPMSRTNETRHIEWHELCKCKCRLDVSICNNKQRWNDSKCRCECKKLIDKGVCDKGSSWKPSTSECDWYQSCDVGVCLDYENCKCWEKLVDKLIEECTENFDKVKIAEMALFDHKNECVCSYTIFSYLGCNSLNNQHWNWCLL